MNPYSDYTLDRMYDFIAGYTPAIEPGARYEYSNYGMGLLGQLLVNRTVTPYEELVAQRITDHLGMDDTSIRPTPSMRSRLAAGHSGVVETRGWDLAALTPAGGLRSTARDMLTFVAANLGLEETRLFDSMDASHQAIGSTGFPDLDIGLGWHILKGGEHDIVWHSGGTGGYYSFIGFIPGIQRGVVVMSNSQGSVDDIGFYLLDPANQLREFRPSAATSAAVLERYTGKYEVEPRLILDIGYENGHLTAKQGTGLRYTLYAASETEFFSEATQGDLEFVMDEQEEVTGVVLERGGEEVTARRLSPDEEASALRTEVSVPLDILEAYVGTYELSEDVEFDVSIKDGTLMVKITGQPEFPVFPESETDFFYKVIDARISFSRDSQGSVFALTLHQDGKDHIARKTR